jgi:hypothetical protein
VLACTQERLRESPERRRAVERDRVLVELRRASAGALELLRVAGGGVRDDP